MISLHIEANTAAEMREQLLGLVSMIQQGDAAVAANADPEAVAAAKPATRRKAEPKTEPAKDESKIEETPKRSVFDDDEAAPANPTVTKEQLQEVALAYAHKYTDDALAELVGKYSTTGKFSGIPEASYSELHAELTA